MDDSVGAGADDDYNLPSASITPSSPSGVPLSLLPLPALELLAALRGEGGRRRPNTRRSTAAAAAAADDAETEAVALRATAELAAAPEPLFTNPAASAFEALDGAELDAVGSTGTTA